MILVTGGAGFIGSNFVLDWLTTNDEPLINLDALTYAGNLENLASFSEDERHTFVQGNIGDTQDNHSKSVKNVLRGLHYQIQQPQGKLVSGVQGEVFEVAVDIRTSSPIFGKWLGKVLSADNKKNYGCQKVSRTAFWCFQKLRSFFTKPQITTHRNTSAVLFGMTPPLGINGPSNARLACLQKINWHSVSKM